MGGNDTEHAVNGRFVLLRWAVEKLGTFIERFGIATVAFLISVAATYILYRDSKADRVAFLAALAKNTITMEQGFGEMKNALREHLVNERAVHERPR